jgi:GntR family carbon starvation induced transcriptional regulator
VTPNKFWRQSIFENIHYCRKLPVCERVRSPRSHLINRGAMPSVLHPGPEQTLNASAVRQIRSDIIACRLMPNERLRVESLRARYGMGTSPIREALMRLEAEGLVELEQNKGFRVSEVSCEKLVDLMRTRIEIEAVALRWSLESAGVPWEAELLGSFHRLSRQTKMDPAGSGAVNEAWTRAHAEFHAALVAACGSPTLLSIRSRLFEQAERYVALSIMASGSPRDDVGEHKQLMRAALDRDSKRILELNRAHITRTLEKVSASLDPRLPKSNKKSVRS